MATSTRYDEIDTDLDQDDEFIITDEFDAETLALMKELGI